MREAIAHAEVGDDLMGEDPTVQELERVAAKLLGKDAALFVTSGTQGNLVSLLSQLERGESLIAGRLSHIMGWEGGGISALGGIFPTSIEIENDGTLDLKKVEALLRPDDPHFAPVKVLALENTFWGKALPISYLKEFSTFAKKRGLKTHLDGARLFNAVIETRVEAKEIASHFDTLTFCLSKGLGAPIGSIIAGPSSFIKRARHFRKMVGGSLRQSGILAAAGLYALKHNIERIQEDHMNAKRLAEGLSEIKILQGKVEHYTNMVFVEVGLHGQNALPVFLRKQKILIPGGEKLRLVLHLDISSSEVETVITSFKEFFAKV